MKLILRILFVSIAILTSCSGGQNRSAREDGDTLHLKYAEHLTIVQHDDYTQVELADPWNQGKILQICIYAQTTHVLFLKMICLHMPNGMKESELEGNMSSLRSLQGHFILFFCIYSFLNIFIFNWRIIALQYCVSFCHTSTRISHKYIYIPSLLSLPPAPFLSTLK